MNWDYIIVGGGSAGCVLANRLSASGRDRVLLLEAGPSDRSPYIHIPAGLAKLRGLHWGYMGEPDPSKFDATGPPWGAGKVLGGGSSVNGMVWVRGNHADFDEWAELGCGGWDFPGVLPYFKRAESFEGGADTYRGGDGPTRVCPQRVSHRLTDAFIQAAQNCGYASNPDYNGERQEGVGVCQTNQRRGFRHSTARAYLAPARRRKNLDVFTGALVKRVLFEGRRAVGVEFERRGKTVRATASKEVIVSAGAIASPKVLMLSGVGPAEHLREHGIEVVADSPGVGQNLQEHPVILLLWNVNVSTLNMERTPQGFVKHGLDFMLRGRGPVTAGSGHALLFMKLRENPYPDVQAGFAPFGMVGARAGDTSQRTLDSPGEHDVTRMELLRRPSVTIFLDVLHPKSRGEIRLRSSNHQDPPVIRHQMLGHEDDLRVLMAGCRAIQKVFETDPLRQHVTGRALPGPRIQTDQEWERFLRTASWGAQHPTCSCKMGSDSDPLAVLDPQLRVRGVERLRVVDASVMPLVTSGNTNAPTIMIAEKASEMIINAG